jgi:hypothetical protein
MLRRGYAAAMIEMSSVLTPNEKRMYRRFLELDRPRAGKPGGCFASVKKIAERLAMHPDAVRRGRRDLARYGLLMPSPEGVNPVRWFPTLPRWVQAEPPETIRPGRATDVWLRHEAHQLDAALSAVKQEREVAKRGRTKSRPRQDKLSDRPDKKSQGGGTNRPAVLAKIEPADAHKALSA